MKRSRSGAAALEFALTLPIVLMITLGTVEYSWGFMNRVWLNNAARDAIRSATGVEPAAAPAQAERRARQALTELGVDCRSGCSVRAEVREGTYDVLALQIEMAYPRLTGFVPAPGNLAVEYVMMLEQQTP